MPPAVSDEESVSSNGGPDAIPAKVLTPPADDDEDDEEEGEDEYRVETILAHKGKSKILYQIKWFGYPDEKDVTWEPIENLSGAPDILAAYHATIGGDPSTSKSAGKRASTGGASTKKRTNSAAFDDTPTASSSKKGKKSLTNGTSDQSTKRALPTSDLWENEVLRVSSITEELTGKGAKKERTLTGYLEWRDGGTKTQHKLKVLRQRCPQALLDYYEQHLVFKRDETAEDEAKEEEDEVMAETEE